MAEVYRAEQELAAGMVRPCALKVIRPEYSESPDFREMFLDEARCACQLSHPHIVHIYEVGEHDGLLYMAMELVPGETLATVNRSLRESNQRFLDEALFAIGIACAAALEAVHTLELNGSHANLVHRDVSPHNLLLSSRGSLKLIDFGIAKAATNRNLTSPGVTKGKAGYFSPEQAMGKALDGRSDLFSLGITLFKLAAGVTPFDAHKSHADRNGALVRGLWEPLQKTMPGLPQGFYDVIGRVTQVKPDDRYHDAREFREALEHAAFEAGLRVGQSALMGYVSDDGEISSVPSSTRNAAISGSKTAAPAVRTNSPKETPKAPTPAKELPTTNIPRAVGRPLPAQTEVMRERERVTDRLSQRDGQPGQPPTKKLPTRMLVVFAAAIVFGALLIVAGVVAFGHREPPKPEPIAITHKPEPPKSEPTVAPKVEPTREPKTEPVVEPEVPSLPHEPEVTVSVKATPERPPRPKTPRRVVTPAPEPETVPAGEGKLRISTEPQDVVSRVLVDRVEWGMAPQSRPVKSGRYSVSVKLPDGRRSPEWKGPVMPETTTVLIYDIAGGRWQKR